VEGPAELFVEAVARVLAWVDAHKAYLFLTAAVAVGLMAASAAMSLWGLIELGRLAHAASLMPFAALGGVERSREEAFRLLKGAPDPYGKFLEVAKAANAGRIGLAEPWESLRRLIAPRPSEERELMRGKAYGKLDEGRKRALFYAVLALEEAFGVYRAALGEVASRLEETVKRVEVGEPPLKRAVYAADLGRLEQLAEEEENAFDDALNTLRERLNEYAVKYKLGDLLDVDEGKARRLAEAKAPELSKFSGVNLGVKALAALMAYREHTLGRGSAYGTAARYWIEEGGSAWLLYYVPETAYKNAEKARAERPAAVEGMIAEAIRRLFLRPGADYYRGLVELLKGGGLALELERETKTSYVFKLYRLEEGGGLKELKGIKLRIEKVGEEAGIVYALELDAERRGLFERELEMVWKAAEELRDRWPVEDPLPYMLGWLASDVSIRGGTRELYMGSSYFWQVAETKVLFGWSDAVHLNMGLTLEGPRLQLHVRAPLSRLDGAIKRSAGLAVGGGAEGGWLRRLGVEAGSWDGLKRWIAGRWGEVVDAVKERLRDDEVGPRLDLAKALEELEKLRSRLADDKIAREAVAPALLLIQAERLGVNETTLRYFAMVISGAIGGDGYVSAAGRGKVGLTSGERAIALLWRAALAAYGIRAEVRGARNAFEVVAYGGDAVRLARLYFLFGLPLLEGGDDRLINHKLERAVGLGAKGALNIRWDGLRRRTEDGPVAADLTISEGDVEVKYNVYLRRDAIVLEFGSTDRSRAELAARLLRLAGVSAEVKGKGSRDEWRVEATTDRLAAGCRELRDAIAEIVKKAAEKGWVNKEIADRWLDKLESGRVLREGWPKYLVRLTRNGALVVQYSSTNPGNLEREAKRLRAMGLEEGRHFTVKTPEGGKKGYVYILKEGLAYAAWLSVHSKDKDQRELAADFVKIILQRAEEAGEDVRKKAEEIVERGREVGSLKLADVRGAEVFVGGRRHVVTVLGGGAQTERSGSGRTLLRIKIIAEIDGVRGEYIMTFSRRGAKNATIGYAYIKEETDAERFAALVEALTGKKPRVYRRSDGKIVVECGGEHLKGLARYTELAEAITRWLGEAER
jgi:hypothetical protein